MGNKRAVKAGAARKPVDIEKLLTWAYVDELSKRQTSSADGIWDRLSQYGSLGGVNPDPGNGAAQRYPHFGLPHEDAELIEKAVSKLQGPFFDWRKDFDVVVGDLAALISINDVGAARRRADPPATAFTEPAPYGRGKSARVDPPRDVLLLNTISPAALVISHAVKRTRPQWRSDRMRPVPVLAVRSSLSKIIGESRGKNLYTTGSYCPLIWSPSPITVALERADYVVWHRALNELVTMLELTEHEALPPPASATPWTEPENFPCLWVHPSEASGYFPLTPSRGRAGPARKKPRNSRVRHVELEKGSLP